MARLHARIASQHKDVLHKLSTNLVRRFGVSATTVSQALALLTQRGLITSRPGAGTYRTERGL